MPRVLFCNELYCSEGNTLENNHKKQPVNEEQVTKTELLHDFLDERLLIYQIKHTANHFIQHCKQSFKRGNRH